MNRLTSRLQASGFRLLALCVIGLSLITLCFSKGAAAEEDSMSNFRSMIENFQPSAADVGAMIAPEIYSVVNYPFIPQPGQKVTVKAMVGSYNSIAAYKVTKVTLEYSVNSGEKTALEMKSEDQAHGIFSAELPAFNDGDDVRYAVTARDDWGNAAVELLQGQPSAIVMDDIQDDKIDPALDIRALYAAFSENDRLQLCMELTEKAKRVIKTDIAAYGVFILGNDVRYKPEYTENELMAGWMAAYLPNFMLKDLVPAGDLLSALTSPGKKEKHADFTEKGNKFCFAFSPETVRSDYNVGLKIAGVSLAVGTSPMAIKPADTTHIVMLYPTAHSFKVYNIQWNNLPK